MYTSRPQPHYILSITIAVALLVSFIPAADATTCTVHDAIATQVNVTAVPIEVESTTDDYFVLYVLHHLGGTEIQVPVSVTLGVNGTITLSENLEALPKERYVVEKFSVSDPADIDGDCINDITELANPVSMNPKSSHMTPVNITDGAMEIPDWETFDVLSNQSYLKFVISGMETGDPHIYFINSNTHPNHAGFFDSVTITNLTNWVVRGTIFFNVNTTASDGDLGLFTYELYPNNSWPFSATDLAYTMLAANMPIINDNLAQYIPIFNVEHYQYYADQYNTSRLNVVFEEDLIADLESASMNPAEGYGLLRVMNTDDRPGIRDVVIYETIPNEVPRVAGIITTAPQTPLSHVNLRAIQDGIPNAFIRDAINNNTKIANLIDTYVHYTVTKQGWKLEPATIVEVNTHHAASRPVGIQIPERDLSVTSIKPLDKIRFNDWDAFGVKAANVAVLGGLGFPDGTVPDGFAIPFYFYDEFMKHNGLYDTVNAMLADADFQTNSDTRELKLKELRKAIKDAETPAWIITKLEKMHAKFPADTSLRYRSSTSNEDLPSFSGAGLYDSKTQDPEETEEDGIDKSLKAVYASLWNFRAFAERDFHRVYHPLTAMGVLVHPNYSDELANGVAVSFDPKSGSTDAYYINTQIGEDLITNPDALSIPEEIMLDRSGVRTIMITTIDPESPSGSGSVPVEIPTYSVLGTSNHMPPWALLLNNQQLGQMRHHLTVIHDTFKDLYGIGPDEQFAMEIEFKITSEDVLAIKQARPWVFYSPPAVEDQALPRPSSSIATSSTLKPQLEDQDSDPIVVSNPRKVTGLTLENAQYGVLVVSWDEPTEAPKKYRVSWAKVGEPYLPKNDPTGNMFLRGTSHTITDLEAGEKYKVKVRSIYDDGGGRGPWISTFTIAVIK